MYRRLIGLLIAVVALGSAFFVLNEDEEVDLLWYEGGTLHQSSIAEWRLGSERDQLATTADWVTSFEGFAAPEEIFVMANRLLDCINNTAVSSPETTQTHAVATTCHQN